MNQDKRTRISRVRDAISHRPGAPVVKGELTIDPEFAYAFLKWQSGGRPIAKLSNAELIMECCFSLDLDLVCLPSHDPESGDAPQPKDLADVRWFADQDLFVFWVVNGSFQKAVQQHSLITLLRYLAGSPAQFSGELRRQCDQVVATMAEGVAAGAHGIILADDIAFQQSTFMSPDAIERHLLPIWRKQVAAAKKLGVPVFLHSDGNINAALPIILAAGFDGLQCIESWAGMNIEAIKLTYGKQFCLMGNIDPSLLCDWDNIKDQPLQKKRLRRAVIDLLACDDRHGGLIVGTSSGIHAGMSPQSVDYMYRVVSDLERGKWKIALNS